MVTKVKTPSIYQLWMEAGEAHEVIDVEAIDITDHPPEDPDELPRLEIPEC